MRRTLGKAIARVHHMQHRYAVPRFKSLGVTRGQPPILMALEEQDGIPQYELAAKVHLRPPTVTRILENMEETGLIRRGPEESDRRVNRIYLTSEGRKMSQSVEDFLANEEREIFSVLTDREMQTTISVLNKIACRYEEVIEEDRE